ncbi:MAG: hypothetical protein E6J21_06510 [Chloroflexota bacterium]|nr:MAG: hypothetical protein E6J21_06510 [Chloroflexota bacterium]
MRCSHAASPPENEREAILWAMLSQAEKWEDGGQVNEIALEMPALAQAEARLREFIGSLG